MKLHISDQLFVAFNQSDPVRALMNKFSLRHPVRIEICIHEMRIAVPIQEKDISFLFDKRKERVFLMVEGLDETEEDVLYNLTREIFDKWRERNETA